MKAKARKIVNHIGLGCLLLLAAQVRAFASDRAEMVHIPAGNYLPFYPPQKSADPKPEQTKRPEVYVHSFWMDRYPVTKRDFLGFLRTHSKWRKSAIQPIFADPHYLSTWRKDLVAPEVQSLDSPVTEISWFAAQAYCRAQGKRLPTVDEWEYVSFDRGRGSKDAQKRILEWYSQPNTKRLPSVGRTRKNGFGVHALHGVVWEWTLDFNSAMVSEEARENGTTDNNLFCGSGSLGALDPTDYASFMRYSFRSSLKANYTTENLGFRCALEENL